ncbi:MAG: hypothetical protein HC836_28240 [Richelia sp. RM2_1_2]|nr:hypothetical protein [Richelia sp. SM2_1_7]NJM20322.1 hypothetical protein [Richelia sp. SM1_7_0]NJN11107.1 hypothetical protein [Richelia sp. RM1_1_1]NJO29905.1 hypothetical protein [Richelia sp. SL_2_1]NJO61989.1 hypothetical protein [Richelia sp. RM2_1_2]
MTNADDTNRKIDRLTNALIQLTDNVNQLTSDTNRVLARSAILDDIIPELRESQERQEILTTELKQNFEQHLRNFERFQEQNQNRFEEHQRTTNAAIERLEAILTRMISNEN